MLIIQIKKTKKLIPTADEPKSLNRITGVVLMFPRIMPITYTGPIVINPIAADVYKAIRKSFFIGIIGFIITKLNTTFDF